MADIEPDAGDGEALASLKSLIRDLGDMACIGCRTKTCPACGLAAEVTNGVHVLLADVRRERDRDLGAALASGARLVAEVRRETAERIARAIRARRRHFASLKADHQYLMALDDAYGLARNARHGASRG